MVERAPPLLRVALTRGGWYPIDSADFCVVRMKVEDKDYVSIKLNSSDVDGSPVQVCFP